MKRVAVVDYGMGNLRSVANALQHVATADTEILVTQDASLIEQADRVVFPGQGAIRDCMAELANCQLEQVLRASIGAKPFLGICIGLQALLESSEEHAGTQGLGIFKGRVRHFGRDLKDEQSGERLKVPHMGWNQVSQTRGHPLWRDIDDNERFYFVHSYFVEPEDQTLVACRTRHGVEFASGIACDNLFAVQFHPEKSQHPGLTLLRNFLAWDGSV